MRPRAHDARASPLPAAAAVLLLLLLLPALAASEYDSASRNDEYQSPTSRLEPPGAEARSGGGGASPAPPASTDAPHRLPSLRAGESFTACYSTSNATAPLHLTYGRPTRTPVVFIRAGGPEAPPCAVLKLSCRIRTSAKHVTASRKGLKSAYDFETWGDGAWGEVASQALLEALSPEHYAGRGSGALLAHAGDEFLHRVPDECIWRGEGDPLVGAALRFVPGLRTARITESIMRDSVAHPESLREIAATWILVRKCGCYGLLIGWQAARREGGGPP